MKRKKKAKPRIRFAKMKKASFAKVSMRFLFTGERLDRAETERK